MTAQYKTEGGVAVITLDNPPVNGLGFATRSAIVTGVEKALADADVKAIVLTGAVKAFSGGADIKEFNTPVAAAQPNLLTVIATIEQSTKPVVAALSGLALGGGLELALGCHYRIAVKGCLVGLPEVKLGLIPGAGGTQRLPRLVGLPIAVKMITGGDPLKVETLPGLVDKLVEQSASLEQDAINFARAIATAANGCPKVSERAVPALGLEQGIDDFFKTSTAAVTKAARGLKAPLACLQALRYSIDLPFAQGLKSERELFVQLLEGTESKAMRHLFFAERNASKVAGLDAKSVTRTISSAAVIGAGTMGSGIAMNFINAGIPVVLLETNALALEKGRSTIVATYQAAVDKSTIKPELMAQRLALLSTALDYAAIGQADIIIEAVFEDMQVKKQVFEQIDQAAKAGAILASNTSTLDVDAIAAFTKRPQEVVGTHFFSPAHVMKLLEVVRGQATQDDVLLTTMQLAKTLNKVAVVSGVCDGFIGNRMIEHYGRQAAFMVEEGAAPEQVDAALEAFGMAMGPFRMSDLAGLDVGWYIRKRRYIERPDMRYARWLDILCEQGRYGQKTGAGIYRYETGNRAALVDPIVTDILKRYRADTAIVPRTFNQQELIERCIFALVNEGARLLDEGIAQRASDIDVVYLSGYGFPKAVGGPMFYADTVGLPYVVERMAQFAANAHADARFWTPAPLLQRLVQTGSKFNA
jgi:3-hydroxyacyl-CoA dehydrogenase